MTNIRLKKTDSSKRRESKVEETKSAPKSEGFSEEILDDDLSKKRKMILTGITAGVGVAGAAAAGLLFIGPYSPFGENENEKQGTLPTNLKATSVTPAAPVNAPAPLKEESSKVQVPQPVVIEHAKVIPAPAAKEQVKTPAPSIAVVAPQKIAEQKPLPLVEKTSIPPPPKAPSPVAAVGGKESSGPTTYNYDILDGGPVLDVPSNRKIYVSRDPNFKKIYLNGTVDSSGKYRISIPPPGEIYWKDEAEKVHKMIIYPPESSSILANIPEQLKLTDNIKWNANGKVSFYRVEIATDLEFLNKVKVFSTVKTSIPVQNIGRGRWYLKISALNLQSGTWESTKIFPINIEESTQEVKESKVEVPSAEPQPQEEEPLKAAEPVAPVEATVPEKAPIQTTEE